MKVGYARVSTVGQNLDRQLVMMKEVDVEKIFKEKASGKDVQGRPVFQDLLQFVRRGDVVVVASLDRLGRNYDDIKETVQLLQAKSVKLEVLDAPFLNFATSNSVMDKMLFDMFLSLLGYLAQSEREKNQERQRQGIELAKKRNVYKGRAVEYSPEGKNPQKRLVYDRVVADLQRGVSISQIARETGICRATVYKIKNQLSNE